MADQNIAPLSESEEMYLVTIARLVEGGEREPLPLSRLAEAMSLQPISVNQMVRKLATAGLLSYQPYKGVSLLPVGWEKARRVLRRRRLWEVFLVENLGLSPAQAQELACHFEHVTSPEVAERLDAYLGRPQVSPSGRRIPQLETEAAVRGLFRRLDEVGVGEMCEVVRYDLEDHAVAYMQAEGLRPGVRVKVLAHSAGGVLLAVAGRPFALAAELAQRVWVQDEGV